MTTAHHTRVHAATVRPWKRLTWGEAVSLYLPRPLQRAWVIQALPMVAIVLPLLAIAVAHRRTAFIDEAIYIRVGRDYLARWAGGATIPDHGDYLSGAPQLYPVLAALVDRVGGLYAVRTLSLVCVLLAVWAIAASTRALTGSLAAGYLAAAVFAWSGPVILVGWLATMDALVVCLLAGAVRSVLIGRTRAAAGLSGVLVALAVLVKYTAAIYLPVVVGLALLFAGRAGERGRHHRASGPWAAAAAVLACAAATLLLAGLLWWDELAAGVRFTTTARVALTPTTTGDLLATWGVTSAIPLVLSILGAYLLAGHGWRTGLAGWGLLLASFALPLAHIRLGEDTSFQKHLAYSFLFLAPLAGVALHRWSRSTWRYGPVAAVLGALLLTAGARAEALFSSWTDARPALAWVEEADRPGRYLSSSADVLAYHTSGLAAVTWDSTFVLYADGPAAIDAAVAEGRYGVVVVQAGASGSPAQDAGQARLLGGLEASGRYQRAALPDDPGSRWVVYVRR